MGRRRTSVQAELKPVYVRPQFDRQHRAAKRDWCAAAYCGDRHRPKPGQFDPLWLRLGMRVNMVEARAGWVVSNPIYDETLRRRPDMDPSLPGPGWLHEVYRWKKYRDLVTLPGVRAVIEKRLQVLREAEQPAEAAQAEPAPGASVEQPDLFA